MSDFILKGVNYKFIRNLTTGGTSSVRLYFDEANFREVCVKFIQKDMSRTNIDNEVSVLERISNIEALKNKVPQLYNHGSLTSESGGVAKKYRYAIVTNYIKGKELHSNYTKLKTVEKIKVFRELVDIVCLLHLNDIIHADIKLENIIYNRKGISLIDFGSSKILSDSDEGVPVFADSFITTFYISPIDFLYKKYREAEDESDESDSDDSSTDSKPSKIFMMKKSFDVWSVGVCYACLFNHPEPVYREKPSKPSRYYLYSSEYIPFEYHSEHTNSPFYQILEKIFVEDEENRPSIFEINDEITETA